MESGVSENAVSGHIQLIIPGETACFAVCSHTNIIFFLSLTLLHFLTAQIIYSSPKILEQHCPLRKTIVVVRL